MSTISNYGNIAGSTNNYNNTSVDNQKKKANETENTGKMSNSSKTDKNGKITGKTIGQPKLSEKAAKYYEQLKKKYSNMDFILVSEDQKENAKAQAGSYANASKTVVLIDEDKIERMVEESCLSTSGADVKGYGMQVNDGGTASFFAVLKKSSNAQKERIEKKKESAKAEKKAEEKKAKKKEQEERLKKKKQDDDSDDTITITASSIEELIKKIEDYTQNEEVNNVQTKEEKAVGQHIDFKG